MTVLSPQPVIELLLTEHHWLASVPDGVRFLESAAVFAAFLPTGKLVGRTAIVPLYFIEGTYVDPEYRGTSLAVRLIKAVENHMRELGNESVLAMSRDADPQVGDYLSRFGYEQLPVSVWIKNLKEK